MSRRFRRYAFAIAAMAAAGVVALGCGDDDDGGGGGGAVPAADAAPSGTANEGLERAKAVYGQYKKAPPQVELRRSARSPKPANRWRC